MAKRRTKRTVKQASSDCAGNSNCTDAKEPEIQNQSCQVSDHEVERRIAATQAIRNAEIEHLLTALRLLRSNFNNEQLQTPVLQYFKENMPNLTVKRSEKDGSFQVEWKDIDIHPSVSQSDERNLHALLLEQISKGYPDFAARMPPNTGLEFSNKAVNMDHLRGAANFPIPNLANSQRLSVGMTPKTRRLPKPGEMLLSVHGSPLGVYKEDNMEAICESEEG